jgi:hypothetical protein
LLDPKYAWIDADEFAKVFHGARVYVYACSTIDHNSSSIPSGFGPYVVSKGVRVFVGHRKDVFGTQIGNAVEKIVHALWLAFLKGEDNTGALRIKGQQGWRRRGRGSKEMLNNWRELSRLTEQIIESLEVIK